MLSQSQKTLSQSDPDQIAEKQNAKEKIHLVYKNQVVTLPGSFVLALFFGSWYALLAQKFTFYIAWYALFAGFLVFRIFLVKSFFKEHRQVDASLFNSKKWELWINSTLMVTAAFWSTLSVYNIQQGDPRLTILTVVQIIGAAATGITSYPGYRFVTVYWTPAVIFPMIFPLYFGEIQELKLLIVAIILFYFTLLNSMKINIATVLEIFTEKEKNRKLAMDLNKILLDLQEKKIQIQDLQQKQIQSNKMVALGEMAGGIAHEINTPLMSIKLLVSHIKNMLQKTPVLPDKIEKATSNIDSITDKIANIINGLRSFARDSQQDTFQKASLTTILHEILSVSESRLKENNVALKIENTIPDVLIECQQSQIAQIILNLLNNSLDAVLAQQNRWIKISIKGFDDENNETTVVKQIQHVQIQIVDSGLGIPDSVASKMMQPFFTTKDIGQGTGLGLSISEGLAKNHFGKLYYDNTQPNTTFVLVLPVTQQAKEKLVPSLVSGRSA